MSLVLTAQRVSRWFLNRRGIASMSVESSTASHHVYVARGQGDLPPIVLLHGIGSGATPFGRVMRLLRRRSRLVVVPDAAGHGFSSPPRTALTPETFFAGMAEVIDQLVDEPFILYGNSLGGGTAIRYALSRSERVRGLIISSPAGARGEPADLERLIASFRVVTVADALALMAKLYHRTPFYAPLVARGIRELFQLPWITDFFTHVSEQAHFAPAELASLRMPIVLLWGRSDNLIPRAHLDYFRRYLPKQTIVEEPEATGHCPQIERPRALAARIAAFAEAVARRSSPIC